MYGWLYRHLPGPAWLRVLDMLILAAIIVLALFHWVFPWVTETFQLTGNTVG